MTKAELLERLRSLEDTGDTQRAHQAADALVIEYIDDAEIAEAYEAVPKWFA